LKFRKATILFSLVALAFGLAAMIFTFYPAVQEVGSRKSSPDFYQKQYISLLTGLQKAS